MKTPFEIETFPYRVQPLNDTNIKGRKRFIKYIKAQTRNRFDYIKCDVSVRDAVMMTTKIMALEFEFGC